MRPRVHVPGMGAGVPLDSVPLPVPVSQMPRRTDHRTEFHGCQVGLFCLLDDEGVCKGYRMRIIDPWTNHTYDLDVEQEIRDEWIRDLNQFPDVGQKPDEPA